MKRRKNWMGVKRKCFLEANAVKCFMMMTVNYTRCRRAQKQQCALCWIFILNLTWTRQYGSGVRYGEKYLQGKEEFFHVFVSELVSHMVRNFVKNLMELKNLKFILWKIPLKVFCKDLIQSYHQRLSNSFYVA